MASRRYSRNKRCVKQLVQKIRRIYLAHFSVFIFGSGPGSPGWITVTEQGIRQSFDLTRVMFSRGNITEKIRFGRLVQPGEVVLDLYGGIGYFTLPALVHGRAKHVFTCEWNDEAVEALNFNLRDNHVDDRATVLVGDCRVTTRQHGLVDAIDRVSLGLLPSSEGGWSTAVQALRRRTGGWLHVHGNVPFKEATNWCIWLCRRLRQFVSDDSSWKVDTVIVATHLEKVKSFAPTVFHYVADVFVGPVDGLKYFDGAQEIKPATTGMLKGSTLVNCPDNPHPPSCTLSPDGVLSQEWMR